MRITCALFALFLSLPAAAQTVEERLVSLNAYLQRGFAALDIDWSTAPAPQQARIGSAVEISTSVKRALTPDLQASPFYPPLAQNLARLDEAIGDAKTANACAFARQQVADALARRDEDSARRALDGMTTLLKTLQATKRLPAAVERFTADRKALEANLAAMSKALEKERTDRLRAEAEAKLKLEAEARERARVEAELRLKQEAEAKKKAAAEAKAKQDAEQAAAEAARQQAAAARAEQERLAAEQKARAAAELADKKKREAEERERAKAAERAAAEEKARAAADEKARAAAEAAERARADAAARAAAEEAKRREKDDPRRLQLVARQTRDEVASALQASAAPASEKLLAAAVAAVKDLARVAPDRARIDEGLLDVLRLRSFARRPGAAVPPARAKLLRTLTSGVATPLELWDGWCYVGVASSDAAFQLTVETDVAHTRFSQTGMPAGQFGGWCTGAAGRSNVVLAPASEARTVLLLGWPVDMIPTALLTRARLEAVSSCDERSMALSWRGLVPGSVLFAAEDKTATTTTPAGPVLILDPGGAADPFVKALGTDGVERPVRKALLRADVTAAPPPIVPAEQCPALGARLKETPDPRTCREASDRAAAPSLERLVQRLRAATNDAAREAVEKELRVFDDEVTRRRRADCAAVDVSPARAWRLRQHAELAGRTWRGLDRAFWLAAEATEGR